jgi:hypothetical protein
MERHGPLKALKDDEEEELMFRFPMRVWLGVAVSAVTWLGAGVVVAQSSGAQPHPKHPIAGPVVTAVSLRPVKTRVGEPCPANPTFYGEIATDGATTVKYTWVSSDGRSWPTRNLKFTSATTQSVSESWKLGAPGKHVNKWIELQILSPNRKTSNKVDYVLNCAK